MPYAPITATRDWNDEFARIAATYASDIAPGFALHVEAVDNGNYRPYRRGTIMRSTVPTCTTCGAEVEDAGDHADNVGHWPWTERVFLTEAARDVTYGMAPYRGF